jgi:hypothetical protein
MSAVARLTPNRSAISVSPTGSGSTGESVEKVLTEGQVCRDNIYMTTQATNQYVADLHARADELEAQADLLRSALLAPSMKEDALRDEAAHLRSMAR